MPIIPGPQDARAIRPTPESRISLSGPGGIAQLGGVSPGIESAGRGAQDVAQRAGRLISEQEALFLRERARMGSLQVTELNTKLQGLSNDLGLEMSQRKGKDAVFGDLRGEFRDKFDKGYEDLVKDLDDDEVREQVDMIAEDYRQKLSFNADRHHVAESDKWEMEVFEGARQMALETVVLKVNDPPDIVDVIVGHEEEIETFGESNGWSAEMIEAQQKQFRSEAHVAAMERMDAEGHDFSVRTYFNTHKGELTKKDFNAVAGWVKASSMKARVQEWGDKFLVAPEPVETPRKEGPKLGKRAEGIRRDIEEMREAVRQAEFTPTSRTEAIRQTRKEFEGEMEDLAVAHVNRRYDEFEGGVREMRETLSNSIYDRLRKGASTPFQTTGTEGEEVIGMSEWTKLDKAQQFALEDYETKRRTPSTEDRQFKEDANYQEVLNILGENPAEFERMELLLWGLSHEKRIKMMDLQQKMRFGDPTAEVDRHAILDPRDVVNNFINNELKIIDPKEAHRVRVILQAKRDAFEQPDPDTGKAQKYTPDVLEKHMGEVLNLAIDDHKSVKLTREVLKKQIRKEDDPDDIDLGEGRVVTLLEKNSIIRLLAMKVGGDVAKTVPLVVQKKVVLARMLGDLRLAEDVLEDWAQETKAELAED